ncbi:MAG TPA: UDP-4-amino-4,6-dideoxy-N-acetyl-beta-L-altrosamine transaminase [Gemmatimonadaceae bacterium]|nr:UDP-4-amino-4,6-dideoxy-N-acetyl-beta-L-altrosamine transaminase [Gemmatimonadaceae bacterium]
MKADSRPHRVIPYGTQEISDADVAAVTDALRDPLLTQGPRVAEFEDRLASTVGARHAVAFNSGTAALHGAYFAVGLQPGRSVVTSPITFVATANASLYLGGTVRFADIDPATVLVDPRAVASTEHRDVQVLAPVHFGGQVADMAELERIARQRDWKIVEDAAHALGATYRVRGHEYQVGACAHSDACCFSFHPVKHITTGEGGAVTTNDEAVYRKLLRFRTHGITRDASELLSNDGAWYYEQHDLGFNYRITDFQCALGMSQLERLRDSVARRRALAACYDRLFADRASIRALAVPAWSSGAYHLYVVRVPSDARRRIFDAMRQARIGVNVHYIPVYRHPYYRAHGFARTRLPHAEAYYAEAMSIPMFPGLTEAELDFVVRELCRLTEGER